MKEQKTKSKSVLKTCIIILILIAAALLVWRFCLGRELNELAGRLWPGSHMGCEIVLTVDGQPCPIDPDTVIGLPMMNRKVNKVTSCRETESGCKLRCRGREYGKQPFQFSFRTADMAEPEVMEMNLGVSDWWALSDWVITIQVDTAAKTFSWEANWVCEGRDHYYFGESEIHEPSSEISISDV